VSSPAARAQTRLLRALLIRARSTAFGRAFGFTEVSRASDVVRAFRERVPLSGYDDHREAFEAARAGLPDVLWPGRMRHFAVSSGTTSEGRLLPRSPEHLTGDVSFSISVGQAYVRGGGAASILLGKHLTMPGRVEPDPARPEALVGEVSGLVAHAASPIFRRRFQAVAPGVYDLPDWEERLDTIARIAEPQDVRLIAMVPSWSHVLFARVRAAHRRRTGRRVHHLREVWPNLRLFVSGGVALSSYRPLLREEIGGGVDFVETYGASEGFFAYQDRLADPAMRLVVDRDVFFEFVPFDALGTPDPPRLTVDQVRTGVRYVPYVSTRSGLWAYGVGDVIRFTEVTPHPKIVVAGRTREVLDRYGEAVHVEEARAALEAACRATGVHALDFHVASMHEGAIPHHRWLVELSRTPADGARFVQTLDAHLRGVNRHYTIRRDAGAFRLPEVVVLPEGTFRRWLAATRARVGAQTKVPRLREDGATAEALLAVAGDAATPLR
jgi:hypothetical protein